MGMHQSPVPHTAVSVFKGVRTRLYQANQPLPSSVVTYYRENPAQPGQRQLLVLDSLSHCKTQPYTHDVTVSLTYRRKPYRFRIFFKRHKLLPINNAVHALAGVDVEGDVLLAAVGKTCTIRNLRGGDEGRAATYAFRRTMQRLAPFRTRRFPPTLTLS